MKAVIERAYAKINLYLDVVGKREDGYHELITIMQNVSLYDEVRIEPRESGGIFLECEGMPISLDARKNLAYIAAEAFFAAVGKVGNVGIFIKKQIPVSAGLGGGSADAAAVLRGLNRLFGQPLSAAELCDIGMSIGSDVPFCIVGGTQICRGRGEVVREVRGIDGCSILLAVAGSKASTAEQYRLLDMKYKDFVGYNHGVGYEETLAALEGGAGAWALAHTRNVFDALYEDSGVMQEVKRIMRECGARSVVLSGSGPSVFGLFEGSPEEAHRALMERSVKVYSCDPITDLP